MLQRMRRSIRRKKASYCINCEHWQRECHHDGVYETDNACEEQQHLRPTAAEMLLAEKRIVTEASIAVLKRPIFAEIVSRNQNNKKIIDNFNPSFRSWPCG